MTMKRPASDAGTEGEIERGLVDMVTGRTVSHDEVMPRLDTAIDASAGKETRPHVDAAFAAECARQSALVAEADRDDPELAAFLDAALNDIEGWT